MKKQTDMLILPESHFYTFHKKCTNNEINNYKIPFMAYDICQTYETYITQIFINLNRINKKVHLFDIGLNRSKVTNFIKTDQ